MFDDFFKKNDPINEIKPDKSRSDNIKAAVLKGISEMPPETALKLYTESEVKPMKKRNIAKTFIIAAAVTTLGALSLVSANELTDGAVADGIKKIYNVILNGEEVQIEGILYENLNEDTFILEFEVSEDGTQEIIIQFQEDLEEIQGEMKEISPDEADSLEFNGINIAGDTNIIMPNMISSSQWDIEIGDAEGINV